MKKIKKNLIVSVLYQFVAIIYGFVSPRLILAHFGSEVNGLIQSITQFLGFVGFLDMGVSQVVRSALYRPLEEQDDDQISRIMVSGRRFYRRIAYMLLGYVAILLFVYPCFIDQSFDWLFSGCMIVVIAINSFSQYYFGIINEQLIHASQNSYLTYIIQGLCYVVNLIVCIGMVYMNCSIHAIKFATVLVFLIKPTFYAWYIRRKHRINWSINYNEEPISQKWFGVAQHISAVVLEGTDSAVLTLFTSLSHVSVYSVYYMVITHLHGFYQAAVAGIQSAAGAVWAKQNQQEIKQLFISVEMGLHTATVFLFTCTGILLVPFVQVYTDGLMDANYIQPVFAAILVFAYGIRCLRTPYNIWIMAAGHFKQTQKCHIIAAVLNLAVSIFAVSIWGLVGVAVGTLIAMCYQTLWLMLYTKKNLVMCTIGHVLKRLCVDIVAAALVCASTSRITLKEVSYLAWIIMAVKVALIAIMCIVVVTYIFYPGQTRLFVRRLLVAKGKSESNYE